MALESGGALTFIDEGLLTGALRSGGLSLTGTFSASWETKSDWDNATSENGVVHESAANADHSDDTLLKMGYSVTSPYKSSNLGGYWPLHEDSGSTAYDFSGNNKDAAINGPTLGATGILGTTSYSFSGGSDHVDLGSDSAWALDSSTTVSMWFRTSDTSNFKFLFNYGGNGGDYYFLRIRDGGDLEVQSSGGSAISSNTYDDGSWYHCAAVFNPGGTTRGYIDGSEVISYNEGGSFSSSQNAEIGRRTDNTDPWRGEIADVRFYDIGLTQSEIQTIVDVVNAQSSITTSKKSFGGDRAPDLQSLDYSLNSQSITVDVVGSPGTAEEETVTQTLDGATSYSLTWNTSHSKFKIIPKLSTTDPSTTPTINSITVSI